MGTDRFAAEGSPFGLTLSELCGVVYVIWLERLERLALLEQQSTVTWRAAGGETPSCPTFEERQAELDEWLYSPLAAAAPVDRERAELMKALGMRG